MTGADIRQIAELTLTGMGPLRRTEAIAVLLASVSILLETYDDAAERRQALDIFKRRLTEVVSLIERREGAP